MAFDGVGVWRFRSGVVEDDVQIERLAGLHVGGNDQLFDGDIGAAGIAEGNDIDADAFVGELLGLGIGVAEILVAIGDEDHTAGGIGGERSGRKFESAFEIGVAGVEGGFQLVGKDDVIVNRRIFDGGIFGEDDDAGAILPFGVAMLRDRLLDEVGHHLPLRLGNAQRLV